MNRLGPQAKKLFEVSTDSGRAGRAPARAAAKKYTFVFPIALMKKVKHTAIEQEKTVSEWLAEAVEARLAAKQ